MLDEDSQPRSSKIISGIISTNEDIARLNICIQLEKLGMFTNLLGFLSKLSSAQDNPTVIFPAILVFELVTWILTRVSNSSTMLRSKVRQVLLQHQVTLFELSRHPHHDISCSAVSVITLLLRFEDKVVCTALQVHIHITHPKLLCLLCNN
jgi:hypothetical protein